MAEPQERAEVVLAALGLTWADVPAWQRAVLVQLLADLPQGRVSPEQASRDVLSAHLHPRGIRGARPSLVIVDEVQRLPTRPQEPQCPVEAAPGIRCIRLPHDDDLHDDGTGLRWRGQRHG